MSKDESDTISPDKVNNVLNQLRQGSCFIFILMILSLYLFDYVC